MANKTALCAISRKEYNLARYTKIFRNLQLPGISVPFDFPFGILWTFGLNGSCFENSIFLDFSDKVSQEVSLTICRRVERCGIFG